MILVHWTSGVIITSRQVQKFWPWSIIHVQAFVSTTRLCIHVRSALSIKVSQYLLSTLPGFFGREWEMVFKMYQDMAFLLGPLMYT